MFVEDHFRFFLTLTAENLLPFSATPHPSTSALFHARFFSFNQSTNRTKPPPTVSAFTVAIMTVLQFPPRLSRSTEVIMELRYGMCCLHLAKKSDTGRHADPKRMKRWLSLACDSGGTTTAVTQEITPKQYKVRSVNRYAQIPLDITTQKQHGVQSASTMLYIPPLKHKPKETRGSASSTKERSPVRECEGVSE